MNYRSDIDGLRTIAVALVILNHAGFSFFSGGFVGVDVFFVISGFLITAIIFPKITEKKFSVLDFLSRRIKRLMPVLLFVVLVTAICATFIMLPEDLMRFYKSIVWVVLYGANFFFWIEHGGYFDGGSQEAPLLHTWSLAVEEQYYLLWPLMLLIAIKFFGSKITGYLAVAILLIATIFSQWGTEVTLGAAYYLLPTRFFELLLGSCLAIYWNKLPKPSVLMSHLLSVIGLTLIIASALILTKYSLFPGFNALYPTIGAALLIYSTNGVINNILSYKPIVYTGNISYSLYLWHWPLFVFFRYTSVELTLAVQLLAITLTYLLSILSYTYIEKPLRYMKVYSFRKVSINMYLIPSFLLIVLALAGIYLKGYPNRFSPEVNIMEQAINSFASKSRKGCHDAFRNSINLPQEHCKFGEINKPKGSFFIFGDSHANHLVPFFDKLAKKSALVGQDYTLDRCLPVQGLNWGSNLYMATKCRERNDQAIEHIKNEKFNYVILAASWPYQTTKRIFSDGEVTDIAEIKKIFKNKLSDTINSIVSSGAIPIIVEDTPTLNGKSPKCPIKYQVFNEQLDCGIKYIENAMLKEIFSELKVNNPSILVINPRLLYCNGENCKMTLNGLPLYRDDDHLNEIGAKLLATEYLKVFKNPFGKVSL